MSGSVGSATPSPAWVRNRDRVQGHFRQGAKRWTALTGGGPVSRIRHTVRAGRGEMRELLLGWLPADLSGQRVLDAGCGTGVLAWEMARRGARVTGVDLAEELVEVARGRAADHPLPPSAAPPEFVAGDFLEAAHRGYDWVVSMDCFIHYPLRETLEALRGVEAHTRRGILLTVAPWTPLLGVMHAVGRLFPRGDRAPGIVPLREGPLRDGLAGPWGPTTLRLARSGVVHRGFYISRGVELVKRGTPA